MYDFCENVLDDKRYYYPFELLKGMKDTLRKDGRKIKVTDFGAGSHLNKSNERSISSIAKSAVSPAFQSQFLFRLIQHYKPNTMLEFGTSLGITALYQALPNKESQFITLEGCPNIASIAQGNFDFAEVKNIDLKVGEFGKTLNIALDSLKSLDYVFFDGNHKKEPTLEYFQKCLSLSHEHSIFIFDDIHWSDGMEAAWDEIKTHPSVSISLDLFFMGILFFRKENKEQEHFTLIPSKYKPWVRVL